MLFICRVALYRFAPFPEFVLQLLHNNFPRDSKKVTSYLILSCLISSLVIAGQGGTTEARSLLRSVKADPYADMEFEGGWEEKGGRQRQEGGQARTEDRQTDRQTDRQIGNK